ncbi:MAG: aspartyl-tRNA(Asn)/glutamyl-tRNA(Gln) amidotransferase subunit A [Paracoccaceae bacterium]|jgi:aspartyl-tRNA(Asn)/glutamyl-tRNA(Gln) amidotransferase subunit A
MSQEWLSASASDLGRGIESGEIDPLRLTETYLAAIDAHELRDRIYSAVTHDRALAEASAAAKRAKAGTRRGLLDGVPISWKDLFDSAGTVTEAGTAYLKGRIPDRDAVVLENATFAGLVCLGKTHMSELAFSGLGYNPITQTPPCVNDADAVPGGSSSGAAASVAFGLAACGIGSDTGGSVRIPAAWNDLVGLKTTHGLLSLEGVVPLCESFDTVGPLCRSVEDVAHMLAALSGDKVADLAGHSLKGRRFLALTNVALDDIRDAPKAGFEAGVAAIKAAGGIVEFGCIPEVAEAMPLSACLFTVEAYAEWHDIIEAEPDLMFPEILERFRTGKDFGGLEYVKGWMQLRELRAGYLEKTAGYDAVIVPTSPILPPNVARLASEHDYYVSENLLALRNTRIGNLMGLAAVSIPTGIASAGVSLLGAPFEEARLLRLSAAVEAAIKA